MTKLPSSVLPAATLPKLPGAVKIPNATNEPTNTKGFIAGSGDIHSILAQLEMERSQLAGKRLQRQADRMSADNALQKEFNKLEDAIARFKSAGQLTYNGSNGTYDKLIGEINEIKNRLENDFGITFSEGSEVLTNASLDEATESGKQMATIEGDGNGGFKVNTRSEENKSLFDALSTELENKIGEISDREDERNITISRYQNQMSRSMQGSAARQQAGQQLFSAIFNRI